MYQRPVMQVGKIGLVLLLIAPVSGMPQQLPALDDDRLATFRQDLREHLESMAPIPAVRSNALVGFRVNRPSWEHQSRGLNARDVVLLPGGPFVLSETFEQEVSESLASLLESDAGAPITWQLLSSDGENREFLYEPPPPPRYGGPLVGPFSLGDSQSFPPQFASALEAAKSFLENEGEDAAGISAEISCGEEFCRIQSEFGLIDYEIAADEASIAQPFRLVLIGTSAQ